MAVFVKVNPGDPIQAHQLNQIIDALIGTPNLGVAISMIALSDALNYALTVQNLETGNSRALNVLRSDGTLLIKADASGVALAPGTASTNVGQLSGVLTGTLPSPSLAAGGVTNANLGSDTARANLLTNGGFEIWQRGNGPFTGNGVYGPDRWENQISGTGTISTVRDTTNVDANSLASAAVTYTSGAGDATIGLFQPVATPSDGAALYQLRGRTCSLSLRLRTGITGVRLFTSVNGARVYSTPHPGNGTWQTLSLTVTYAANEPDIYMGIEFTAGTGGTAYLDNAMLVVGGQPANYAPLTPADDLARCLRYYETPLATIRVLGIATAASQQADTNYQFKARKAVTPSVTINAGGWAPVNSSNPPVIVGSPNVDGMTLEVNSSAAGVFYNYSGANGMYVEANP